MDKTRELTHLNHFKGICPFFPEGAVEETERPDFIIHTGEKHLGIEHTEIFQPGAPHGGSLQAQDNLAQRVVERASELYLQKHSQPLFVQILFNSRSEMKKRNIDHVAQMIVHLIEKTPVKSGVPFTLRRTRENSTYFPKEVTMVHICRYPNGKENKWFCSSAGFILQITQDQLQEKINEKEQKLDSYALRCSELWLLIVADNVRIPSSIDLTQSAFSHHYITRFDRAFFFWNSSRRYVELQLG